MNAIKLTQNRNLLIPVIALCLTSLMSTIDSGIVNIGLSTIESVFHVNFAYVQWIILSYLLAVTSLIVGIGRIGDIFGKKRLYIGGIILFTVTSLLCGISTNIMQLIISRVFQGIGGAILIALSFAIIGDIVPKERMRSSMTALTATLPIGFALGPSLGGIMISGLGWRSIFFVNIPLGILALVLTRHFPPVPTSEKHLKFDLAGMIALAGTLTCYVLSVTLAENQGLSKLVIFLITLVIIGIFMFIHIERHSESPLVRLSMFRNKIFSGSLLISILFYSIISGFLVILPFYLQEGKSISPAAAGLIMMSGPLGCAILTPVAGGSAKRFGNIRTMIFGIIILSIGVLFLSQIQLQTNIMHFIIILFFTNGSLAFFQTPNNAFIMALSKPEERGLTSGLLNLSRTIGQTTGNAVVGAIFYFFLNTKSVTAATPIHIITGIHNTLFLTFFVGLIAFVLGLISYQPWQAPYKTIEENRR